MQLKVAIMLVGWLVKYPMLVDGQTLAPGGSYSHLWDELLYHLVHLKTLDLDLEMNPKFKKSPDLATNKNRLILLNQSFETTS